MQNVPLSQEKASASKKYGEKQGIRFHISFREKGPNSKAFCASIFFVGKFADLQKSRRNKNASNDPVHLRKEDYKDLMVNPLMRWIRNFGAAILHGR